MGKKRTVEIDRTPKIHRKRNVKNGHNKSPEARSLCTSPALLSPRNPSNQSTPKTKSRSAIEPGKRFQTPRREEFFLLSQTDSQADIAWDCESPDALRQIKIVKNGKSGENIADLVKILATEESDALRPTTPPLLGLWLDREREGIRQKKSLRPHKNKNRARKKMSVKVPVVDSQLFDQLTAAILRQNNVSDTTSKADKGKDNNSVTELFSDNEDSGKESSGQESRPVPDSMQFTNVRGRESGRSSDIDDSWADGDDLFNDSSFIYQATQIPAMQSPCAVPLPKSTSAGASNKKFTGLSEVSSSASRPRSSPEYVCTATKPSVIQNSSSSGKLTTGRSQTMAPALPFKVPSTKQYSNYGTAQAKPAATFVTSSSKAGVYSKPADHLTKSSTQTRVHVSSSYKSSNSTKGTCSARTVLQMRPLPAPALYSSCSSVVTSTASVVTTRSSSGLVRSYKSSKSVQNLGKIVPGDVSKTAPSLGTVTCSERNDTPDWDNSLSDEVLSQLLEPDDFLDNVVCPSQPTTLSVPSRKEDKSNSLQGLGSSSLSQKSQTFDKPVTRAVARNQNRINLASDKTHQSLSSCTGIIKSNVVPVKSQTTNANNSNVIASCTTSTQKNSNFVFKKLAPCPVQSKMAVGSSVESTNQKVSSLQADKVYGLPGRVPTIHDTKGVTQPKSAAQPSLSQQCTPEEIEKKKQEALKRRRLKSKIVESKTARRS